MKDYEFRMSTKRRLEILERHIETIYECFDVLAKGTNICTCPPKPAPQFPVDVMLGEMGSNDSWVKVYYYHYEKNWTCHCHMLDSGKNEDFFGASYSLKEAVRLCYINWKEGTK